MNAIDLTCPKCERAIPLDDLNVSTDIAICRACGREWKYSRLRTTADGRDLVEHPPKQCWFEQSPNEIRFGVSTRSCAALFLVPFAILWSGGSLAGIYFGPLMSGHLNLALAIFGIPFLLGTLVLVWVTLMTVFGRIEVTVTQDQTEIFTGFGGIGRRKRFDFRDVTEIEDPLPRMLEGVSMNDGSRPAAPIVIITPEKRIRFGLTLTGERRDFILAVLRYLLDQRN